MTDAINFTDPEAGAVVSAAVLKANFDAINTYLANKVDIGNIKKDYSVSCVSFNHESVISGGSPEIHYHAFKPAENMELEEVQLYVRTIAGSPAVKAQLYTAYDGATYTVPMLGDDLSVASANTWDTDSSPSTTSRLSGQPIYIKVWNSNTGSAQNGYDVTLNIWFKIKHQE